ncbi:MAG: four helix bundle protein [Alphaproteobacteria bacterium]|nr:four helix bundle protein [Alphaproteobacteria bacterium]
MGLYSELPVYRDSYNLLIEIYQLTNKFSRDYKYSLGQDMKRDALNLFRNLYRANRALDKKQDLENFLDDFELLKMEIRLCVDMRLLPLKKMAQISLLTDSIGKQITAWRNKSREKNLQAGIG